MLLIPSTTLEIHARLNESKIGTNGKICDTGRQKTFCTIFTLHSNFASAEDSYTADEVKIAIYYAYLMLNLMLNMCSP